MIVNEKHINISLILSINIMNLFMNTHTGSFQFSKIHYFRDKHIIQERKSGYKVYMKLNIKSFKSSDAGVYSCVSKNSFGEDQGTIQLYGELSTILL